MASFASHMIFLIASLLLIFPFPSHPSIANPSVKITLDDLTKICSQTDDPLYCVQALQSDSRTMNADLHGLAEISIELAETISAEALTMIDSLAAQAIDPELKDRYAKCSINYNVTISFLEGAKQKLSSGDFDGVYNFGARGNVEADSCEARFEAPPREDSSSLWQLSHNLGTLTKLVSEIAIYLLGH